MPKDPLEYLKHISDECNYLLTISQSNLSRDRLIHDYMGVDYSIVWDVVKNKIPILSEQISEVIQKEE